MNAVLSIRPTDSRPTSADDRIRVEVLTGHALVDGVEMVVSGSERLLLAALARCRHAVPHEQIAALLWPDLAEERAHGALRNLVHRLRRRLGEATIAQSAAGYQLGDRVVVDLWEIEAFAASLRRAVQPDLALVDLWLLTYRRLCCGCEHATDEHEFLRTLERRLRTAAREITDRFAACALRAGQPARALALARATLDHDACAESALDIAIRAHLALGDRAAAIREYRDYTRALADELGLAPSFTLHSLVA